MRMLLMTALLTCVATTPLAAQTDANPCPLHAQHMAAAAAAQDHGDGVALDHRGDQVMGFEHTRTTHHFLLAADGGSIQVEVTDPKDAESLGQIRGHLTQVASAFAGGDFAMTRQIHDRTLPGTAEMARRKSAISYRYEETERGARVRITTLDPEALEAIHAFLRAQIEDHRTGDVVDPATRQRR